MLVAIQQAIRGLRANLGRTALTSLGVVVGIGTVVFVLGSGEGFKSYISAESQGNGSNAISITTRVPPTTRDRAGSSGNGGAGLIVTTLKERDLADVLQVPNVSGGYGASVGQLIVSYRNISKSSFIVGASADLFAIDSTVVAYGRPFTSAEDRASDQVVVLGSDIATDLFGDEDPLGKIIRVGTLNFVVVGVYERKGSSGFSNVDQQVFVPLGAAQKKLFGRDYLFQALVQAENPNLVEATAVDIAAVIRKNHTITDPAKDDFEVQTAAQSLQTFSTILSAITYLLIAIAAISLLVGGVGIMNIMYVVVTERTSEIGLKKSLGASGKDILAEFLTEAVLLTGIGGAVGALLGAGAAYLVAIGAGFAGLTWKFAIPVPGLLISLGISAAVGLTFGVLPAYRASKMDPIEALRQE